MRARVRACVRACVRASAGGGRDRGPAARRGATPPAGQRLSPTPEPTPHECGSRFGVRAGGEGGGERGRAACAAASCRRRRAMWAARAARARGSCSLPGGEKKEKTLLNSHQTAHATATDSSEGGVPGSFPGVGRSRRIQMRIVYPRRSSCAHLFRTLPLPCVAPRVFVLGVCGACACGPPQRKEGSQKTPKRCKILYQRGRGDGVRTRSMVWVGGHPGRRAAARTDDVRAWECAQVVARATPPRCLPVPSPPPPLTPFP